MQLSLEARQRIHERYERQSVSQRQLAEDFQVSLSTVKRILKRSKDDLGRRAGSGNPGKVHERERLCIAEYAQQCPDAFLREYVDEIESKCGVRVTEQAVSVHLRKLKWTLKKTDPSLQNPSRSAGSNSGDNDGFGAFLHSKLRSKPTYSRLGRRAEKRLWPVVAIA